VPLTYKQQVERLRPVSGHPEVGATLDEHLRRKQETTAHRHQTQDALSATDDPRSLIATVGMQRPDELAPRFAENSIAKEKEDMPYYHHAQMVMGQYGKYFSERNKRHDARMAERDDDSLISDKLMKMMLMFHDINKLRSIERHGGIGEHVDTVCGVAEFSRDWGFSPTEIRMACVMVGSDPLGEYFKEVQDIKGSATALRDQVRPTLEAARQRCFKTLVKLAREAGVPPSGMPEFFERYMQFYQSDFSSYSTDSTYQDRDFKPGDNPTGRRDEYAGPASFTPEFFEHTDDEDASSPLELSSDGSRLRFASCKRLNQAAGELAGMFGGDELDANLARYAPAEETRRQTRRDTRNEVQRADLEMRRDRGEQAMAENEYMDFEAPVVALSRALSALGSGSRLSTVVGEIAQLEESVAAAQVVERFKLAPRVAATVAAACRALVGMGPQEGEAAEVMQQFGEGGVFVRKLFGEDNDPSRSIVSKDLNAIQETIVGKPMTPYVRPSTLVHEGIPTNLTNAGEELLHSSGLIYDQDTPLAPSTKEHCESKALGNVLSARVQGRIHDGETWRNIVRTPIEAMGGKSYESREGLVEKLKEMELRRSGKIPDLSTKELVLAVLEPVKEEQVSDELFGSALEAYMDVHPLPEFIARQVVHCFGKLQARQVVPPGHRRFQRRAAGRSLVLLRLAAGVARKDRPHSIYGGEKDDRGLRPGNRYHREDKRETRLGSSELEGYDGHTFQTNECLMLPDTPDLIRGVYSNGYSIKSRLHSLNLARELQVQTGQAHGLYDYDARHGMAPNSVPAVLDEIHARLGRGDEIAPSSGMKPVVEEESDEVVVERDDEQQPKPVVEEKPVMDRAALLRALPGMRAAINGDPRFATVQSHCQTATRWMPDQTPVKKRVSDRGDD